MDELNINEVISDKLYTIEYNQSNIIQIRQIQGEFYEFQKFKVIDNEQSGFRKIAGNKLKTYCKANSIILSTDVRDYDNPIISFLEHTGFLVKFVKILYQKNLNEHEIKYKDLFSYHPISEIGLTDFLNIFEKTKESKEEAPGETETTFNELLEYAGDKYDPSNWKAVKLGDKYMGVILPVLYADKEKWGTVFHIGLLPEERNKGYGRILHAKSLDMLKKQGVLKYIGSTNIYNKPMIRVFELNGCKEWFKRKFYCTG